jgi:hypothetical protein
VSKLNPASGATIGTYPVGSGPKALAFDGTSIWVANLFSGTVNKLNSATGAAIGSYPVGGSPAALAFDGSSIWVANWSSGTVNRLNPATGATIGTYQVVFLPSALAFDGSSIWVANSNSNTVTKMTSIMASISVSTVSGGPNNTVGGNYSTVPGGFGNSANGDNSFAAGTLAKANESGMFVWSDSRSYDYDPTQLRSPGLSVDTFNVRATGGVLFTTGLDVNGRSNWGCYTYNGGAWTCTSDRNVKRNLVEVDGRAILGKLAAMPVYHWQPKDGPNTELKHVGPMAQDFYATFGLGDSDTAIGMQDEEGVALAAIQGLNLKLEQVAREKDERLRAQAEKIAELEKDRTQHAARIEALEKQAGQLAILLGRLENIQRVTMVTNR